MKHLSCLLCGSLLVALTSAAVLAQATAQINGTVKDSSGGVLPGATVSAIQTETGFKRAVKEAGYLVQAGDTASRARSPQSRRASPATAVEQETAASAVN